MTKFVGRRGTLGIAYETVRGTPVVPAYWMPYAKLSFFDSVDSATETQGFGNIANSDSYYVTFVKGEGSVDAELYDQGIGYILGSLLGAKPVTTGAGPYTHTFTMSQTNQAASLTLYWTDPDRDYIFPLAVVDSLKVSVKPLGMVEYTIAFKSKTARNWAHQTPVFTTLGNKFLHQNLVFKLAANVASLAAATNISLKELDFTIKRDAMFDEVMGTVEPEDVLSQTIGIDGNLMLNLQDDTYRGYMLNGTYKSMEIELLASANSSLDLRFPRVNFSAWQPDYTLDKIATQKIQFSANYDSANALDIISTAVLINQKTSY
jgi:hypothetical protein